MQELHMGSLVTFRPLLFGRLFWHRLADAGQRLECVHEVDAGQCLQGRGDLGHDVGHIGRNL